MPRKPTKPRLRAVRGNAPGFIEWVGGRLTMPVYVTEGEPFRPEAIFWYELPARLVVAFSLEDPRQSPTPFGQSFIEATRKPLVGKPRRPQRIRVRDEGLAAELRGVVGDGVEVRVGPTPELDELVENFARFPSRADSTAEDERSYLEDGRIPASTVGKFFAAARALHVVAPWKVVDDDEVLRVDSPELGLEGACVSIIGSLGKSRGFVLFPDLAGFEAFLEAADRRPSRAPIDLGTTTLALTFERGSELTDSMRREIARYGWPVAAPEAHPWVEHRDHDGVSRPLGKSDVEIVAACASALASFFIKTGFAFDEDDPEPLSLTFTNAADLDVRITYPYEAFDLFEASSPPAARTAKIGRNEPCPCGSGKKYKKCHLDADREVESSPLPRHPSHDMDGELVGRMSSWASRRFGDTWLRRAARPFRDPDASVALFMPWSVYGIEIEGRTIAAWFAQERRSTLQPAERAWLDDQGRAWLSVWEVQAVEPGRVEFLDLLTHERRKVDEVEASRTLVKRDTILARVVDNGGRSVLCGTHPRPLPPTYADEVVRRLRSRLRLRTSIPVERLRGSTIGSYLIARWEESVRTMDRDRSVPPVLQNTDGEDCVYTVDQFGFQPGSRSQVAARLGSLPDVDAGEAEEGSALFQFSKPGNARIGSWEHTLIASARLQDDVLTVETNSTPRADLIRSRIEAACAGLLQHRSREETAGAELFARARATKKPPGPAEPVPSEILTLLKQKKEQHYAAWLDEPIPALRGKTPRQAARQVRSRRELDLLLRDMENHESRLPAAERFDFGPLRTTLRLESSD